MRTLSHSKNLIKICGITTPQVMLHCIDLKVDMVGLVAVSGSPRCIKSLTSAAELCEMAKGKTKTVLLLSNANDIWLDIHLKALTPDILQFHGQESVQALRQIKDKYALPIIKAIHVETAQDIEAAHDYADVADMVLFDTKATQENSNLQGGTGKSFDWALLANQAFSGRFLLSGGLNEQNVAMAIKQTSPTGVDVSSGVESEKGVKSLEKITNFVHNARKAF